MKVMLKYVTDICTESVTPAESIVVSNISFEVVNKFCLGNMISAGDVEEIILDKIRCGWRKFRDLLPVPISKLFSLCTKGILFQAYVRSVVW